MRHTLRSLARNPGFTTLAVLFLTLSLGPCTALFSYFDRIFLRPLPLPQPDQLAILWERFPGAAHSRVAVSTFTAWQNESQSFASLAALTGGTAWLGGPTGPIRIRGAKVTDAFFRLLGFRTLLGRGLAENDFTPGNDAVVVLSHRAWQRQFGANSNLVGQTILLDRAPHVVVGILTPESRFDLGEMDLWRPLAFSPADLARRSPELFVIGRMHPGIGLEAARAEMDLVATRLASGRNATDRDRGVTVAPIAEWVGNPPEEQRSLLLLLGAALAVQLLVVANLLNLQLVRTVRKRHELAIRQALGATRTQIGRHLLQEGVLIATAGCVGGWWMASWLVHLVSPLMPPVPLESSQSIQLTLPALAFSATAALASGAALGLIPLLHLPRGDRALDLKDNSRSTSESGAVRRLRGPLVSAQIAVALMLLAAASFMLQTLRHLDRLPLGFQPHHLGLLPLDLPPETPHSPALLAAWAGDVVQRLTTLPGVTHAAATTCLPLYGYGPGDPFSISGTASSPTDPPRAQIQRVTPGYAATFGIRLLKGREFSDRDHSDAPRVALINEHIAQHYFPGQDPIGRRIRVDLGPSHPSPQGNVDWEIVGVLENVKGRGLVNPDYPVICLPWAQAPTPGAMLAIRTTQDPPELAETVQRAVLQVLPGATLEPLEHMENVLYQTKRFERHQSWLFGGLAAIAVLLSALGVYGVISYHVSRRAREIGIRMALGASPQVILHDVLRDGLRLTAIGLAAGCVGVVATSRLMDSLLYGVSPTDPVTIAIGALFLATIGLLSSWFPARRAARVDPMLALRSD